MATLKYTQRFYYYFRVTTFRFKIQESRSKDLEVLIKSTSFTKIIKAKKSGFKLENLVKLEGEKW